MISLIVHPLAEGDLLCAVNSYEGIRSGLGQKFLIEFFRTSTLIKNYPFLFRIRYDNIRISQVGKRFPYMIHYEFIEERKLVLIIGVYHAKQGAESWDMRLEKR